MLLVRPPRSVLHDAIMPTSCKHHALPERVLVYSELPSEGDTQRPNDPPAWWPDKGKITFTKAELAYREDLPLVLKGISFEVTAGEKVRISFL
jgi:hypothetical protein